MANLLSAGNFYRLLLCFMLGLTFSSNAEAGLVQKDATFTFSSKNAKLKEVLKEIKRQTGYSLMYSNQKVLLNPDERVSVSFDKSSIPEVMDYLLRGKGLQWQISDESILIFPRKNEARHNNIETDTSAIIPVLLGKVTDSDGKPIAGASISIKGTSSGTSADANGNFKLVNISTNSKMLVSSIGHETKELTIKGSNILVKLNSVVSSLDESIVIAYGTTTKRLSTGNVSTVKAKDIEKQPVNNPLLALQGRVPGLFITQSTGLPGSGIAVRIQGQNTISNGVGNDPLYVIDGVPYTSRFLTTLTTIQGSSGNNAPGIAGGNPGQGNPLSLINPADIESIDILKDADATAIYGSRAANGAILITTKKGKVGQTKVDINIQNGWAKVTRFVDLLNTQQYLEMRREALKNSNITVSPTDANYDVNGTWDTTRYTDWQKTLIGGTAHYTDAQASISGGTPQTQFLLSAGYHRETTVFPGDLADRKGSLHFNINNTSQNKRFRVQLSGTYLVDKNELIERDLTMDAVNIAPIAPSVYNSDGTLNWAPRSNGNSTWLNPLAYLNNKYSASTNNLVANSLLSYQLLPGLVIKSNFGYTNLQSNQTQIFPSTGILPERIATIERKSSFASSKISSWILEPQIVYNGAFKDHNFEALLGSTIQESSSSQYIQSGSGYNSDLVLLDIASAPTKSAVNGLSEYRYNSLFARIGYNWMYRYFINVNLRRDGSSRFGAENRFHNFGSISAAWIFTNEDFIKKISNVLSFGKLRGSYGTTGNDQIGDYKYLSLYNTVLSGVDNPYQNAIGLTPEGISNPYLAWEETKKTQFGLDLGFFKDKILLNVGYYINRSSNQLLDYALPIMTGFSGLTRNFPALVKNFGWELSLNTTNITNAKVNWTTSINLTIPKNELVKFPGLASSSYADLLIVGEPITIQKRYRMSGVNKETGMYEFIDKEGKNTSTPDFQTDRIAIINTNPKFYGGLQNSVSFKGIQLDVLLQFVKQTGRNYVLNNFLPGRFSGLTNFGNQAQYVLDRWQKPGDNTIIQKFGTSTDLRLLHLDAIESDIVYSDASFIRLKNVSISWQFPQQWVSAAHLIDVRFFVQGQNLLTFTNYKGMDPETISSTTLPPLRVLTLGLKVSL